MPAIGDERILFLGASRGLGSAVGEAVAAALLERAPDLNPAHALFFRSRKSMPSFDFSKPESWPLLLQDIHTLQVQRLWYFAGGGPFGPYGQKAWKDHQWALRVNFECPAFLLHHILSEAGRASLPRFKQVIFVGSAVAGENPDPHAASYSAAKHALQGLVSSIQAEGTAGLDLRLFSPTYLDTALLPPSAEPRQTPGRVKAVSVVAQEFMTWAFAEQDFCRNLSHGQIQMPAR